MGHSAVNSVFKIYGPILRLTESGKFSAMRSEQILRSADAANSPAAFGRKFSRPYNLPAGNAGSSRRYDRHFSRHLSAALLRL